MHNPGFPPGPIAAETDPPAEEKNPALAALGDRVRQLRAARGMTRKAVALAADVSERHLANLEYGIGNASFLVLQQVAAALQCSLAELTGDVTTASPEWLLIRELLQGRDEATLRRARVAIGELLGTGGGAADATRARPQQVALIGLRGAGKSTLGRMLADSWVVPFVELNRQIESVAGASLSEIHSLYGPAAYRRYEMRALEDSIQRFPRAVIATPGGIVSDPATFNLLLAHCYTVWVRASPEEHMARVQAQGDTRPMAGHAGNAEAMDDLRRILDSRAAYYAKADEVFDTSDKTMEACFVGLQEQLRGTVRISG